MSTPEAPESFPRQHARTRRFTVGSPRNFAMAGDGSRVAFLRSAAPGVAANSLWCIDVDTGETRLVVDAAALLNGGDEDLPPAERARRERAREGGSGVVAFSSDTDLTTACFALSGRLFLATLGADSGAELGADPGGAGVTELPAASGVFDPRLSPDGARVAYVSGATVRVTSTADPQTPGATADVELIGEADQPAVTWGSADFIAAEEMGRSRGFWWSPDSTRLAVTRVDDAAVMTWHIAAPVDPAAEPRAIRYPAAGTTNPTVGLAVIGLDGSRVDIDWAGTEFEYLADVGWHTFAAADDPAAADLVLTVQSRDQRTFAVLRADARTGAVTELHRHTDPRWVELVPGTPMWAGSALVTVADIGSARRLLLDGEPMTPDDIQVRRVLDADAEYVWLTASLADAAVVHVGRFELASGDIEWLTSTDGVHGAVIGGDLVVVSSATLDYPGSRHRVLRLGEGSADLVADVETYAETPVLAPNVELLQVGARRLATAVLLPHDHDGSPLPVLMDPYGGPHAQRVQYAHNLFLTSQWFADQGFIVIVTDGRGTPGRGGDFEREVWGDLAQPVLEDQVDALRAVADDYLCDLSRVGIRGWSFGGYLAALAVLERPDVFHVGIAGAPVTDWRLYDTHYTERYLGHPEQFPEHYARTDLTPLAPQLDRPLLLIHGLADDNVVAAHTLQLSRALLEAGRPHEVLPLSGVTHMTPQEAVAENLLRLQLDFLRRSLPEPTETGRP
ncbi:MAG: S9 family peptidase [Acidimicrobiales bacterium]|nr:S9 family peptidase [Acidimicrobiales bacterium]